MEIICEHLPVEIAWKILGSVLRLIHKQQKDFSHKHGIVTTQLAFLTS